MSALSLTLTHDDFTPFYRRAQALHADPEPVTRALCTTFLSLTIGNFHGGTQYRPAPWAPLKRGGPSNLQSMGPRGGNLMRGIHMVVSGASGTVGSPAIYAAIHQFGGDAGRGHKSHIPARPFFPVEADGTKLTAAAADLCHRAGERAARKVLGQ